jgi:transcriptional regulator with XRE-family HTH domain
MAEQRKPGDTGGRVRTPVERKAGDFGTKLREARERKGISLRQIADATKISVRVLAALEQNDISDLPGGIFTRAFVRAFAVEAGLNPEETVDDFVRQFPHDSVTAGHPPSAHMDDDEDGIESNRRMASVALRLVVISVPVAAILLYFSMASRRAPEVSAQPAPAETSDTHPNSSTPETPSVERAGRLTVEMIASRACALTASIDGGPLLDVRLEPGGRRTFEAQRDLLLTVNDPSAIQWLINGIPGRSLGTPGQVATAHLTLDNAKGFTASQ